MSAKRARRAHFITPNHKTTRPEHVVFFDTETLSVPYAVGENRQVLKLGWACYWHRDKNESQTTLEWCSFTTPGAFWSFVESHLVMGKTIYLIAHNISFDFRIVGGFEHVAARDWVTDFIYHKQMTTLIAYQAGECTLQLLDLTNFFPTSLAEVGQVVGVEKMTIDFETCTDGELSDYCKNDVVILVRAWEAWLRFLDEHDLGDFRHTFASQAYAAYRHSFMTYPLRVHDNQDVCDMEREAYRGGRVDCFMVGKFPAGQYYQLDVNGMYAYMMKFMDYPRMLCAQYSTFEIGGLAKTLRHYCAVARVIVTTEHAVFPVTQDGFNIYPVGTFETTLTTPELWFALRYCEMLRVGQIAFYEKARVFEGYAAYFCRLKEQYELSGDMTFRAIAKKFANALYGKFGQRDIETDFSFELPPIGPRDAAYFDWRVKKWYRAYEWGKQTVFEKSGGEAADSFPAIPAHVTAYARMYLWSLILQAGRENVFYCDTDSLIVNQAGRDNLAPLLDEHKLGCLKLEKSGSELEIWAPKDYRIGDKAVTKGVKKDAQLLGPCVFEQDQFLGLRGAIRRGDADLVTVKRATKRLHREITTGIVRSGGVVEPFRLFLPDP